MLGQCGLQIGFNGSPLLFCLLIPSACFLNVVCLFFEGGVGGSNFVLDYIYRYPDGMMVVALCQGPV